MGTLGWQTLLEPNMEEEDVCRRSSSSKKEEGSYKSEKGENENKTHGVGLELKVKSLFSTWRDH
jgi:hypothetical protein